MIIAWVKGGKRKPSVKDRDTRKDHDANMDEKIDSTGEGSNLCDDWFLPINVHSTIRSEIASIGPMGSEPQG